MWLRALTFGSMVVALLARPIDAGAANLCDELRDKKQQQLRDTLLSSQHPYECCDETIAECLKKPWVCSIVTRLRNDICRRIKQGQTRIEIERSLVRRAQMMMPAARKATIDLGSAPTIGDGPLKVGLYICARCPLCAKITPELHRSVTQGALRGKVSLFARLYPTKGHADSATANVGLQAAHGLGQFWPFALKVFGHAPDFSPDKQLKWARDVGMDQSAFEQALKDPKTREKVVASKKEGISNGVKATPTLFVNGRRYTGDLDIESIEDILLEIYERNGGR